jgi:hypothetical protein
MIAAVNGVLTKLNELGTKWDGLVDQLMATSNELDDTARTLHAYQVPPTEYLQMQQACNRVMSILATRLRLFAGPTHGVPSLAPGEALQLVSFLPNPLTPAADASLE